MKNWTSRVFLAAVVCLGLSACEGDSRPFSEAVEVRAGNLVGVVVTPPANSPAEIFLNIDQRLQFGLQGMTAAGALVPLDSTDRDWQVSDSSVATISADGQLRALSNDPVDIFVKFGGLTSAPFSVTVDNRDLQSISLISGAGSVERCRPQDYFATGIFEGGSTRTLDDVRWTLPGTELADAGVLTNPDGTATLTALNLSALSLTATSDGQSLSLPVEVADTLRTLEITPNPAGLDVGATLSMVATAGYVTGTENEDEPDILGTRVVINEQVNWAIDSGELFARVSNTAGTRGQVTGVAAGAASVSASCGALGSVRTLIVSDVSSTSSSSGLSFNVGSPYNLPLSQTNGFRFLVSTGSSYDAANDITQQVTWTFTNQETTANPISLIRTGSEAGRVTPVRIGTAVITATDDDGRAISLTVEVIDS